MGLEFVSGGGSPVTVADMTDHCRLDGLTVQTDLMQGLIDAATDYFQGLTRQQLLSATYRLKLDAFPGSTGWPSASVPGVFYVPADRFYEGGLLPDDTLRIPLPPLVSIASVTYVDDSGQTQTLNASTYTVDTTSKPGRIRLKPNQSWPSTARQANAVTVEFACGYGPGPSDVPAILKLGIKLLAAYWYENREAAGEVTIEQLPLAIQSIIDSNAFVEA